MIKRVGKRAQMHPILWVLIELCLVAVIFLAFFTKLADVKNDVLFDKIYLSKDIALLTDAVYASPGDLSYVYGGKVKNFSVSFNNDRISIYQNKLVNPQVFPYVKDSTIDTKFDYTHLSVFNKTDINFEKLADTLTVTGGKKTFVSDNLGCAKALTTKFRREKDGVVLDPYYHEPFPGLKLFKTTESNVSWQLANTVLATVASDFPATSTRRGHGEMVKSIRYAETKNKQFSISFMLQDDSSVNIQIKDEGLENKKLACLLINGLSELDGMSKGIISITDDEFVKNNEATVSIMVELPKDVDYTNRRTRENIGAKIKEALVGYYE